MERNYRIIEITLVNGVVEYKIQRECRWLKRYIFFGPKVWKTYEDVYDGNWSSHIGWCFAIKFGEVFTTLNLARKELNEIIKHSKYGRKISTIRIYEI